MLQPPQNIAEVLDAITNLKAATDNLGPAMQEIGRTLAADTQMNFRQGRSPYGEPWAPITHRAGQPLRDTRRLQNSIEYQATEDSVELGTNVEYAPAQQFGVDKVVQVPAHTKLLTQVYGKAIAPKQVQVKAHSKNAHIKARPFLPITASGQAALSSAQQAKVLGIIHNHLEQANG